MTSDLSRWLAMTPCRFQPSNTFASSYPKTPSNISPKSVPSKGNAQDVEGREQRRAEKLCSLYPQIVLFTAVAENLEGGGRCQKCRKHSRATRSKVIHWRRGRRHRACCPPENVLRCVPFRLELLTAEPKQGVFRHAAKDHEMRGSQQLLSRAMSGGGGQGGA
jgi:hypothetical protein